MIGLRAALVAVAAGSTLAACSVTSTTGTTEAPVEVARSGPEVPSGAFTATVTRISDGDTLWVEVRDPASSGLPRDDVKLRLLRIDTPELARDGQPAECLAEAATDALEDLVPVGSTVLGAHDVERQDRFGRDLVHLWKPDGTWVNGWMLGEGYASVVTFPPNTAFDDEVRDLERAAREAERGLWDPSVC